jgi:hypothetical protein
MIPGPAADRSRKPMGAECERYAHLDFLRAEA